MHSCSDIVLYITSGGLETKKTKALGNNQTTLENYFAWLEKHNYDKLPQTAFLVVVELKEAVKL